MKAREKCRITSNIFFLIGLHPIFLTSKTWTAKASTIPENTPQAFQEQYQHSCCSAYMFPKDSFPPRELQNRRERGKCYSLLFSLNWSITLKTYRSHIPALCLINLKETVDIAAPRTRGGRASWNTLSADHYEMCVWYEREVRPKHTSISAHNVYIYKCLCKSITLPPSFISRRERERANSILMHPLLRNFLSFIVPRFPLAQAARRAGFWFCEDNLPESFVS